MRIGVSNRHAILSLPTRLLPAPARGRHFRQPPMEPAAGSSVESQASCSEPTELRASLEHRRTGQKGEEWLTAPDSGLRIVLSETAATLAGVRGGRGQRPPHAQRPACPTFPRLGAEPHPGSTRCGQSWISVYRFQFTGSLP